MRLKDLENCGIHVEFYNKQNDINIIHGKLTYVSKDSIIVMGSVEGETICNEEKVLVTESVENIVKRNKIKGFQPINYTKKN